MKNIKIVLIIILLGSVASCKKYLDVVPDNVATLENAFTMRNTAETYLFTCYSYLPSEASAFTNPGFVAGDENWFNYPGASIPVTATTIARNNQNVVDPSLNFWDGTQGGEALYNGIRDCNIFLENIGKVPDMDQFEKDQWASEVKFLKAYYHFWLLRMYGPIPLIRENLPVTASKEELEVERKPVDECFNYIVGLIDSAVVRLPDKVSSETSELGRVTRPIAMSMKAKILVYAASPLFNGNTDYVGFKSKNGTPLFNAVYDRLKWEKAVNACKEAIEICHASGHRLYYYNQSVTQYPVSDVTRTQMNIRNSVCEKWNNEIIWGNTNSMASSIQSQCTPRGLDPTKITIGTGGNFGPPLNVVENFYSKNGVPITEDNTWDYAKRYDLKIVTDVDKYNLISGYTTARLNFDREPRFYADLAFDGAIWYGQGRYDESNSFTFKSKLGQPQSRVTPYNYTATGYQTKKLVSYNSVMTTSYQISQYPWPVIRLADLYLLFAEALNEYNDDPTSEVYDYLNLVRERAGLKTVQESWTQFSTSPNKYLTKPGLRQIIHQERTIELAFEGHRFWDLLRWKEAANVLTGPVKGWSIDQSDETTYYKPKVLFNRTFTLRDYFWPIKESNLSMNQKLIQNPGW